ncbi:unnamed protein product [Durusdinium trenchii]|uniref:Uncharacterized protein n=1 Tax=Durusdinium trenchii TaxID=1381693 RepID=A0ABP0RW88_9DINO
MWSSTSMTTASETQEPPQWPRVSETQGATAVAKSLGKLVNLNHVVLNFAFNNLGAQGATAVAESVGKLENLNHVVLNFENIGLGAQGATAVAQSLGKLVNLNHVQLNFNGNSLGDQGRRALKSLEEQVAARCSIKV